MSDEYARRLREAGNEVVWRHYDDLSHGWLQMTAWSQESVDAVKHIAEDLHKFLST